MSDELRAWLEEIEERRSQLVQERNLHRYLPIAKRIAEDDIPALIAKVEELAGALEVYADPNRWEIAYDVDTGDIADDRHVFVTDESEPWSVARSALRAPGGATGKHPVVEGNRGSIAQKHDNEAVSPSRESRRAPGGGE